MMTTNFVPILLGSDINVYGMARAFHEKYDIKSYAYCHVPLAPTKYSKIVDVTVIEGIDTVAGFVPALKQVKTKHQADLDAGKQLLLIPCGDVYSEILSETQDDVRSTFGDDFTFTIIPFEMLQKLINKSSFYKVAEEVGLPYPKTKEFVADNQTDALPFDFPVALKPANSTQWLKIDFEGKKKAFIIEEEAELRDVLKKTYEAGYTDIMICQEFVRGDDSQMRVVNGYVDRDHNVRLLSLGNPLLEDPSPIAVGNYMAILPVFDQEIYTAVENFIKKLGYVGFINMDLKIDSVTGKPYFFEVNIRQGRSSYFVTANGANLAEYYVRDMVDHEPFTETVYTDTNVAWLGLPKALVAKYASNNDTEKKLLELVRQGKYANTVSYPKDMSFMRRLLLIRMNQVYKKNYATYFVDKTQL